MKLEIETIKPNPQQPRKEFDPDELKSLADSIEQVGLINPIAVEDNGDGTYTLIDGERRWRASQMAGLSWIEAYIKSGRNGNGANLRLAEATAANMQRSDMNVIEQAHAIKEMLDAGYDMAAIRAITGFTQTPINLRLMILSFSPVIQEMFARKQLPLGSQLVHDIDKLPVDVRDGLLARCVTRHMTEKRILSVLNLRAALSDAPHPGKPVKEKTIGAIDGALNLTSNKLVPEILAVNVTAVCKRCGMARSDICKSCPILDLVDMWRVE